MDLFGTHRVSLAQVRRMAVRCYALEMAAHPLLLNGTHDDPSGATKAAYEELFTEELLALAIALRTKLYQGLDPSSSARFINPCGFLYRFGKHGESTDLFTVKDVCDKIIHASTVQKYLEADVPEPTIVLEGTQNHVRWQLSFSVSLFIEGLLNWLDTLERNSVGRE
jgi:hypothetical protein